MSSSSSSTTMDQKKNKQQGETNSGTSPNNIKKPDTYGFMQHFTITIISLLFYIGIIGSVGLYTAKTVAGKTAGSVNLYSQVNASLNGLRQSEHVPILAESAKTSAIANYFSHIFIDVFSWNTSFIEKYSRLLSGLSNWLGNWSVLCLYGLVGIPLFIGMWIFNFITNAVIGVLKTPYLFYEKHKCNTTNKPAECKWSENINVGSWWKIIPIGIYMCFFGLVVPFFSAFYTTSSSLLSPLMRHFTIQTSNNYGFKHFLMDIIVTNKSLWLIIFSISLLYDTDTYLGGTYTVAAAIATLVAYWKIKK